MNVLGFDYGSKLISVALGNRLTRNARPLGVATRRTRTRLGAHRDVGRRMAPDALVVGLPLTKDGEEQKASRGARVRQRACRTLSVAAALADERMSSIEASRRFAARRADGQAKKTHAAIIDAVAAEVILENWLSLQP